ncbi:3-oxoacyl-[acyl-carrier-protein] synthase III C-terminal domain-containing protein [Streptosporangium sp. NPDC002544]|uniref:3-oxoacyl-[acyl-carrier-protein] synthase III C-terminal domain-containing protein n=1 Tax=Streptosporangium sp. NPDC002544 TaxID=3154538 RepID=UPI0033247BEE
MNVTTEVDPHLIAVAAELPRPEYSTDELIAAGRGHLSDRLVAMLSKLGIQKRHSILSNYPDVLFRGAEPELDIPASTLAARAVRTCLAKADVPMDSIGLVLGVSSSPARLLPSLVCDLFALIPEIPRTAANLSIEFMGCSSMAKAVDTARWFLNYRPEQHVLVCFMDAITPLSPELPDFYSHFSEVDVEGRQGTVNVLHGFLFADAAVAMVFGAQGGGPSFGPVANLTNERASDAELGTVPDGGSDIPLVYGRRAYTLSPDVTPRGAFYASETLKRVLDSDECKLRDPSEAAVLLMHTGSTRILDELCAQFGVQPEDDIVGSSYRVLRDYGNTIGCSVPLMLAEPTRRPPGQGLVVSFGLSFACGAFTMNIPDGGWRP